MKFIRRKIGFINEKSSLNLSPEIRELLFQRNLTSDEQINHFLFDDIKNFKCPKLIKNLTSCCEKILYYVNNKKNILIFGDYDADGICATTILYKYLSKFTNTMYYLPNRFEDGYGLNLKTAQKIITEMSPDLVITVDCGITCHDEIEYLKSHNIDVIVTDHHELPAILPDCIVVNTKQVDEYNFSELCGAGLALKIIQYLVDEQELKQYIPIAMIATIADIVPLISENRIIVKEGLKNIKLLPLGIKKLIKACNIADLPNAIDISYRLAPKINAAGRMGDATLALKLFIETDESKIDTLINELMLTNERRQDICNRLYIECKEMLSKVNISEKSSIVLYKDNWESGVLGIISARLVDEYCKPCVLLAKVDNEYKGSCRGIKGLNIVDIFEKCSELTTKFGGHSLAGGVTIAENMITDFANKFELEIKNACEKLDTTDYKNFDLEFERITNLKAFMNELSLLEPFGFGNPVPTFLTNLENSSIEQMKKHPAHLVIKTKNKFEILAFNEIQNYTNYKIMDSVKATIELQTSNYMNKIQYKGVLKNVEFKNIKIDYYKKLCFLNYLSDILIPDNNKEKATVELCNKEALFDKALYINSINQNCCFVEKLTNYSLDACNLFFNKDFENFNLFKNIIFSTKPNDFVLKKLFEIGLQKIYILSNDNPKYSIDCNREIFTEHYKILKSLNNKHFIDYFEMFNYLKRSNQLLNFYQTFFTYFILKELGIIEEKIVDYDIAIKFSNVMSKLEVSKIYQWFLKEN